VYPLELRLRDVSDWERQIDGTVIRLTEAMKRGDEMMVNVHGRWVHVAAATDVDRWEVLATWATEGRSMFEAFQFLRKALSHYDGMPTVYVDRAPWYRRALDRLGVPWGAPDVRTEESDRAGVLGLQALPPAVLPAMVPRRVLGPSGCLDEAVRQLLQSQAPGRLKSTSTTR